MEREQNDLERQIIEDAIRRMEWEGAPLPGVESEPSISPDQGIVPNGREDPTHPLRRGRIHTGQ